MPRFMKWILIGIGSLLGIVLLAVVVLVVIPDDTYRGWLTAGVESATGRKLSIDGDFTIETGSSLGLKMGGVNLENPEWASTPTMFTVEQLEADVRLLPLFKGVLEVSLLANGARINLETRETGGGNWEIGKASEDVEPDADSSAAAPSEEAGAGTGLVIVPTLKINDGRVEFLDGATGWRERFDLQALSVAMAEERLALQLDGTFREQAIRLSGRLDDVRDVASGNAADVALQGEFGDIALDTEGTIAKLMSASGPMVDLKLAVNAPSTHSLEPFAGTAVPDIGRIDIGGKIRTEGAVYHADELSLSVAGHDTSLDIQGRVADLVELQGIELATKLDLGDLPALVEAFAVQLPGTVPALLQATATVGGGLQALALRDLEINIHDEALKAVGGARKSRRSARSKRGGCRSEHGCSIIGGVVEVCWT